MKKTLLLIGVAAVTLLSSGCASIVSKTTYDVAFTTNAPKATVTIRKSDSGLILSSGEVPHVANLKSSDGFFSAASYICEIKDSNTNKKQTRVINGEFCPWFLGNFIFGGIIGMGVDGATGAVYQLDDAVYAHFSEYDN